MNQSKASKEYKLGLFCAMVCALIWAVNSGRLIQTSIGLQLGIFVCQEPFDLTQFISFVFIWAGLVVFTVGGIRSSRVTEQSEGSVKEVAH